jgi:hypothetical protein
MGAKPVASAILERTPGYVANRPIAPPLNPRTNVSDQLTENCNRVVNI